MSHLCVTGFFCPNLNSVNADVNPDVNPEVLGFVSSNEALVKFGVLSDEPQGIICTEFEPSSKVCKRTKEVCMLCDGFQKLK